MDEAIQRSATREKLANLGRKDLLWLKKQVRRELKFRWQTGQAALAWKRHGWIGLANFMAGVTWAMACRQSLRRSKGHAPDTGVRPQSGEMWMPRELLYALRHEVKERGWSPLAASCWSDVHSRLTHVPSPREGQEDGAVAFKVRLVRETAAAHIDTRVWDV